MKRILILFWLPCLLAVTSSAQNIGLGTDNPQKNVHIHDGSSELSDLLITSAAINDSVRIIFGESLSGTLGIHLLYDGLNDRLQVFGQSNGGVSGPHLSIDRDEPLVGIGTGNPQEALDVVGGIRLGNTTNTHAGTLRWTGSAFEGYNGSSWNALATPWSTAGSDLYYNSGQVGIGVSSPVYKLEVESTDETRSVQVVNHNASSSTLYGLQTVVMNAGTGTKYGLYSEVRNNATSNDIYAVYGWAQNSGSGAHYGLYGDAVGSGNYAVYGNNTSDDGWSGYFNGRAYVGSRLNIATDINLGQLHIHDPDTDYAKMYITPRSSSEDSSMIFLAEDTDATFGMFWAYDGVANEIELFGKANSNVYGPHMKVQRNDGNVSIGDTYASGYRLSVDGKIACEEVRVELSGAWPDYVFSDNYPLMDLDQLGRFLAAHNHLPGIPAADEIHEEGLEMGEMQRKMMEKIEELTLYVIELKKEIEVLKTTRK